MQSCSVGCVHDRSIPFAQYSNLPQNLKSIPSYPHDFSGYPVCYSNFTCSHAGAREQVIKIEALFHISLSAAGRLLFCLIKKVVKKIKFAVTQTNERLGQVGLKVAFVGKHSDNKPTDETTAFIGVTATDGRASYSMWC